MGTVTLLTNPRKRVGSKPKKRVIRAARKAKTKRKYPSKARATAAARVLRRRRRNPSARGIVDANLMPAIKGAVGAVAIDTAYDMLPIPANLQVGAVGNLVKMGVSIGMGMAVEKFKLTKGTTAREMVNGALTVQLTGLVKELVGGAMGAIPAGTPESGAGYISASPTAGALGMYESGAYDAGFGLGVYEQAPASY